MFDHTNFELNWQRIDAKLYLALSISAGTNVSVLPAARCGAGSSHPTPAAAGASRLPVRQAERAPRGWRQRQGEPGWLAGLEGAPPSPG